MKIKAIPIAAVVAGLLLLSACDSLDTGGEEVILPVEKTFTFEFTSNDVQGTQTVTIQSNDSESVDGSLAGFSRDEIVSARVTSASLNRVSSGWTGLNQAMANALVQVVADGQANVTVANLNSAPAGSSVDLTVTPNVQVGAHLSQPQFRAALQFTPAQSLAPGVLYRVQVEMQFSVSVEGL